MDAGTISAFARVSATSVFALILLLVFLLILFSLSPAVCRLRRPVRIFLHIRGAGCLNKTGRTGGRDPRRLYEHSRLLSSPGERREKCSVILLRFSSSTVDDPEVGSIRRTLRRSVCVSVYMANIRYKLYPI